MKVCFISDTHTYHDRLEIPECDVLCHTGDATYRGRQDELESFSKWFRELPIEHKLFTGGNHDLTLDFNEDRAKIWLGFDLPQHGRCYYLHDNFVEINGLKFYGNASTPKFGYGWGFNLEEWQREEEWNKIPNDTDVILTHGPVQGILDKTWRGPNAGCDQLLKKVRQIKPLIHACGHIHEAYGVKQEKFTTFINSSVCTLDYDPDHKPIVVTLDKVNGLWKVEEVVYGIDK